MSPEFAQHEATASYVTHSSLLTECDYHDDREELHDQSALIRLDWKAAREPLQSDELTLVQALRAKLGVQPEKRVIISPDTTRGYRATRHQVILSEPFGPYYQRITIPWAAYKLQEVGELCDRNPITAMNLFMIPDVEVSQLRTHRLTRMSSVSLHFQNPGLGKVWTLLAGMQLGCTALELRNVDITPEQLKRLKVQLRYPYLQSLTVSGDTNRGS